MAKEKVITLKPIDVKHASIFIEGYSTLCLNKVSAREFRKLMAEDRKVVQETPNEWEDIATSIHWRDPIPVKDTYKEMTEAVFLSMLKENAPCIHAFGLKKSFGQAVVRNGADKYSTKFDASMNIITNRNLVPITFAEWSLEERLMSPQRGAPISVRLNHFSGWKANFDIEYVEHVYTLDAIVNFINLAGFSIGIGSGRTSGYGRYHVVDVK